MKTEAKKDQLDGYSLEVLQIYVSVCPQWYDDMFPISKVCCKLYFNDQGTSNYATWKH